MADPQELPFAIEWLASAAERRPAVDVCDLGHLRVNGRTCWSPDRIGADFKAIWFRFVEHEEAS